MKRLLNKQKGSLLIGALALIVIVALTSTAVTYIVTSSASSITHNNDQSNAFYIAEAGLTKAAYLASTGAVNCDSITDDSALTNIAFNNGTFTVTATDSASNPGYCTVTAKGGIPSVANPTSALSTVSAELESSSIDTGWLVGQQNSDIFMAQWDGSTWTPYTDTSHLPNKELTAIAVVSADDIWSVGKREGGNALLIKWNGSNWTRYLPSPSVNKDLHDVACISANDCWAVGDSRTFLHWNGSTWTSGNVDTSGGDAVPNKTIYSISCTASNDCWAVGDNSGGALFAYWNGTQWKRVSGGASVANEDLYDVYCTASNDCWAVGNKYSATESLFMHWNGSTWSRVAPGSPSPSSDINMVSCTTANSCWAGGASGLVARWNGSNWTEFSSPVSNLHINGIDVQPPTGAGSTEFINWKQE
jgi:Tfp pilus assembly protein PilX